ncbi:MAG: efflux RND transporter periplasmic adaptor subunit [Betaproteobacteria bacterium]
MTPTLFPLSRACWLALATAGLLVACKPQSTPPSASADLITVNTLTLQSRLVADRIELDGTVAPVQQVNVTARVAGKLLKIGFKDGDQVKAGQLLFAIEPDTYIEQVKLNQARLDQAKSDYQRQTQLMKENATSVSNVESDLSNMQQAEANLRLAQINLAYTEERAPFDGIMGRRQVDIGNYVGAAPGGTVLGTIVQIAPAYVNAAVSERDALRIREKMGQRGQAAKNKAGGTPVTARLQTENPVTEVGALDFVDHVVGGTSGTVALRGKFANQNYRLFPGLYAQLSVQLGPDRPALALPRDLVLSDQQGDYVFVVDADNRAKRRNIRTNNLPANLKEVLSGLSAGEQVVSAGYNKLSDGQAVKAVADTKPQAPAAAASAPKAGSSRP